MAGRKMRRRRPLEEVEPIELEGEHETAPAPLDPRTLLGIAGVEDPEAALIAAGAPPIAGTATLEATSRWRDAKTAARRAGYPPPPLSDFLPEGVEWHGLS